MKKKSFYLSSARLKVLSILICFCFVSLTIVLSVYKLPLVAIIISGLVSIFSVFTMAVCFLNRIVVDRAKGQIKIYTTKVRIIDLNKLKSIKIDTSYSVNVKKYCFIIFTLNDESDYKISGYSTIFNINSVYYTEKTINNLMDYLKSNHLINNFE